VKFELIDIIVTCSHNLSKCYIFSNTGFLLGIPHTMHIPLLYYTVHWMNEFLTRFRNISLFRQFYAVIFIESTIILQYTLGAIVDRSRRFILCFVFDYSIIYSVLTRLPIHTPIIIYYITGDDMTYPNVVIHVIYY